MIEILAQLTRTMRALMLGQNPPATVEALRVACLKAASEPHAKAVNARTAMRKHFDTLAAAVFAGKAYSEIADPAYVASMNAAIRTLWDEACKSDPA
jgi:hypothetical protein